MSRQRTGYGIGGLRLRTLPPLRGDGGLCRSTKGTPWLGSDPRTRLTSRLHWTHKGPWQVKPFCRPEVTSRDRTQAAVRHRLGETHVSGDPPPRYHRSRRPKDGLDVFPGNLTTTMNGTCYTEALGLYEQVDLVVKAAPYRFRIASTSLNHVATGTATWW